MIILGVPDVQPVDIAVLSLNNTRIIAGIVRKQRPGSFEKPSLSDALVIH